MVNGWRQGCLQDFVAEFIVPQRDKPKTFEGKIPWCRIEDIEGVWLSKSKSGKCVSEKAIREMPLRIFPKNTVIVSCSADLGRCAITSQPLVTNQTFIGLVPKTILEALFLYYLMTNRAEELNREATGATIKYLSQDKFRKLSVSIPSLNEQKRIVQKLDETFAGIAKAKENAEKNLQNARALFESHLESIFTQRGKGWVKKTIGETCTLKSGTTVSPKLERPSGEFPYLKVADMTIEGNEDQVTTSSRFLSGADVRESAIIPKGATIFPKRGGAILTNKKRITALPICADLNIMAVIPSSQINPRLLYLYFLNVDMRKLGTGSSIPQINNYDVSPLGITFPTSLATQAQIERKLTWLREETQRLARLYEQKLEALESLKKSILHEAFTGNL
jgi:type I restriction enzyme S subunit